jgi:hypothetical protein
VAARLLAVEGVGVLAAAPLVEADPPAAVVPLPVEVPRAAEALLAVAEGPLPGVAARLLAGGVLQAEGVAVPLAAVVLPAVEAALLQVMEGPLPGVGALPEMVGPLQAAVVLPAVEAALLQVMEAPPAGAVVLLVVAEAPLPGAGAPPEMVGPLSMAAALPATRGLSNRGECGEQQLVAFRPRITSGLPRSVQAGSPGLLLGGPSLTKQAASDTIQNS